MTDFCPCSSRRTYADCCQILHLGKASASTPEQLMRARFSAYAKSLMHFVLDTYGEKQRSTHTVRELEQSTKEVQWLKLDVIKADATQVEFKAYSLVNNQFHCLHELSDFALEHGQWKYIKGKFLDATGVVKLGRNDICLCNSGKKYKKCCQRKIAY